MKLRLKLTTLVPCTIKETLETLYFIKNSDKFGGKLQDMVPCTIKFSLTDYCETRFMYVGYNFLRGCYVSWSLDRERGK